MKEGDVIESGMVSRGIARAQKRVEEHNFEIRKDLLEYDGVMDEQRKLVYSQRQKVLEGKELRETIWAWMEESVQVALDQWVQPITKGVGPDPERSPPGRIASTGSSCRPTRPAGGVETLTARILDPLKTVRRGRSPDRRRGHAPAGALPPALEDRPEVEGTPPVDGFSPQGDRVARPRCGRRRSPTARKGTSFDAMIAAIKEEVTRWPCAR